MSDYDFSTLNDKDFEEFSRDILNAKFGFDLQSFKPGKDQGIDLKFATRANDNSLVVQAKHFRLSGVKKLISHLKHSELPKVQKINPDRYIIVTSLPLSPMEKKSIKDAMHPFIATSNDVLGKESLNQFLSEHDKVEKRHFKLWLSSSSLFSRFLNNAVDGRTQFQLKRLREKARIFVPCQKLLDADSLLELNKLLIITGPPGVGKTTLSEILILDRVRKDFDICFVNTVREAEDVITPDDNTKQLFYIDDFLGSNYFELMETLKTETPFTNFIERIRHSPNKFLLLTTRTVFLNQAIERYEKIKRSGIGDEKFELQLDHYNEFDKAKIFYNHLYFSNIREDLSKAIVNDKFYWRVIRHKNYTPRLVEFVTRPKRLAGVGGEEFRHQIIRNLDNPAETWADSFDRQIGHADQCLLFTLLSFTGHIGEAMLKTAFTERMHLEKELFGQAFSIDQFQESVKTLQDAFIIIHASKNSSDFRSYSFINPSIADFLISRLRDSYEQRRTLIASIKFKAQLRIFDPEHSTLPFEVELQTIVLEKFGSNAITWSIYEDNDLESNGGIITTLTAVINYCKLTYPDEHIFKCLSRLDLMENLTGILEIIEYIGANKVRLWSSHKFVELHFRVIIDGIVEGFELAEDEDKARRLPEVFDLFQESFWHYSFRIESKYRLERAFKRIMDDLHTAYVIEPLEDCVDIEEVRDRYDALDTSYSLLEESLFPGDLNLSNAPRINFDANYWETKVAANQSRTQDSHQIQHDPIQLPLLSTGMTESEEIDDLFSRLSNKL